jgi:xanthine dehydrogenase iron-sulfur cluster and FAD-binding subunit A
MLRGRKVDGETIEAARAELRKEIAPIDDLRSTADYRLQVSLNLLEDFLFSLGR